MTQRTNLIFSVSRVTSPFGLYHADPEALTQVVRDEGRNELAKFIGARSKAFVTIRKKNSPEVHLRAIDLEMRVGRRPKLKLSSFGKGNDGVWRG
jgi:hypothetical protein